MILPLPHNAVKVVLLWHMVNLTFQPENRSVAKLISLTIYLIKVKLTSFIGCTQPQKLACKLPVVLSLGCLILIVNRPLYLFPFIYIFVFDWNRLHCVLHLMWKQPCLNAYLMVSDALSLQIASWNCFMEWCHIAPISTPIKHIMLQFVPLTPNVLYQCKKDLSR